MSIRRVSPTRMMQNSAPATSRSNSFPKLQDILVDLSVKNTNKVVRKVKLIGDPISFIEYTDKVYVPNPTNDPGLRGKTVRRPFPDADLNKKFNRIGHEDISKCPWKKMGYIGTTQYAQNVLEKQEDGTWEVRILKKGKAIFNKIAEKIGQNYEDETNEDGDGRHYGTRNSPCIKVTAVATGKEPPLSVEYSVSFEAKPIYVTEEMVDLLRKAGEPSVDDLVKERLSYEADRKSDPLMPEWEDFYTYGYPLDKIFKFDPIRGEESTEVISVPTKPVAKEEIIEPVTSFNLTSDNDDEDEDEGYVVKPPVKTAAKSTPKRPVDESSEDDLAWMED